MSDENNDVIKMNTNTAVTDSNGQPIQIKVPQPEYITETFNMHSDTNNDSIIFTGDDE